jgi:uncharacterized protein YkwD
MLALVNQVRQAQVPPAPPVQIDKALSAASTAHSQWMSQKNDWPNPRLPLSHTQDSGSPSETVAQRAALAGTTAKSENIAWNPGNAQAVFNAWMGSSGHKRNILDPTVTRMGIGQVGRHWTQKFGF